MSATRTHPGSTARADFWRFSLAFYARPGVPEACLLLQDRDGLDVNVMLYLLYLAMAGRRIGATDIARVETIAGDWREQVVRPLRSVRRTLKGGLGPFDAADTEALRNAVKRIELQAEQLQQQTLERLAAPPSLGEPDADRNACARNNLTCYARSLGVSQSAELDAIIDQFVLTET